jgi:hypothetical protein
MPSALQTSGKGDSLIPKRYALAEARIGFGMCGARKSSSALRRAFMVRRNALTFTLEREIVVVGESGLRGTGDSPRRFAGFAVVVLIDGIVPLSL